MPSPLELPWWTCYLLISDILQSKTEPVFDLIFYLNIAPKIIFLGLIFQHVFPKITVPKKINLTLENFSFSTGPNFFSSCLSKPAIHENFRDPIHSTNPHLLSAAPLLCCCTYSAIRDCSSVCC